MTTELASDDAVAQATAQHADDPFLARITLTHSSLATPIRIVRNRKAITASGNQFLAYPFEVELPSDVEDVPQARITIANISRRIGKAIEQMVEPPNCLLELALASTPDTVERAWADFSMTTVTYDAFRMTATILRQQFWQEPWTKRRVVPARFAGMFA